MLADDHPNGHRQNPPTGADDPYWTEGWRNPGWLAALSMFLVLFANLGILFSWGTFQPVYLKDVYPGQTDVFRIAFIGTTAHALSSMLSLPVSLVIRRIGYQGTMAIGAVLCPLSLCLASIATQLWHLVLSQGILLGIGTGFCFSASFMLPSEWFVRRRALVNSLANAGASLGGMCFSPLARYLIDIVGHRNALRILAAVVFGLYAIATALATARYPPSWSAGPGKHSSEAKASSSPLRSVPFSLAVVFCLFAPFGYLIPVYLMPTYAMQVVGTSPAVGSLLVSVGMATNVVSRIVAGFVADHFGAINTLFLSTLISGVLIMTIWQASHTLTMYAIYSALNGVIGGQYFGLMPSVLARLVGMQHLYVGGAVVWTMIAVGTLLGTPCFGKLQEQLGWTVAIQFAGATCTLAAICMLAIRLMLDPRLCVKM